MISLLICSLFFQLLAVIIAINLIKITNKYYAWILVASAIILMMIRRSLTLNNVLSHTTPIKQDLTPEYVALFVSACLTVGLYYMIPIFKSINADKKKLEEQNNLLKEAMEKSKENDRLKSAFLANMSHEIRTPMNGILGFSSLLKTPNISEEQRLGYVKIIEQSGARMLDTINEIIDISKIESGNMQVVLRNTNINTLLDEILSFFKPEASKKSIKLSLKKEITKKDVLIKTDQFKINAIVTNLVKNAIKFTDKGSIDFGYTIKDNYIEFFVNDTGIGIPKERQDAIFERFVQADIEDSQAREGTGLGLPISEAYIKMLNGDIWVKSEVNVGSSFNFTIPINN